MLLALTLIELRSPLHVFGINIRALKVVRQLSKTSCVASKIKGGITRHYTMTLWNNEQDMKAFMRSGAHLDAMKWGAKTAREIRTVVKEADSLPDWENAKILLEQEAHVIRY